MRRKTFPATLLIGFLVLAGRPARGGDVGDLTWLKPTQISSANIQRAIDAMPKSDGVATGNSTPFGGVCSLPPGEIDLGKTPVLIDNGVTLRGSGATATKLIYHGDGAALRFASRVLSGYQQMSGVCDLMLVCDAGDGIGLDDATCKSDVAKTLLERLVLNTAGTAIKLMPSATPSSAAYATTLRDIRIGGAGKGAIRITGPLIDIDDLMICTNARALAPNFAGPTVELNGFGVINGVWLEGDFGGPLLKLSGDWTINSAWIEPSFSAKRSAVILDNARLTIDRNFFVKPKNAWELRHGSYLFCAGLLDAENDGGGHPAGDARQAILPQDYLCDETSQVLERGQVVVPVTHR